MDAYNTLGWLIYMTLVWWTVIAVVMFGLFEIMDDYRNNKK